MTTANEFVNEARKWLGTRFHHQGRVKKAGTSRGGCDCIGLIVGVVRDLDMKNSEGIPLSSFDETNYTRIPDGEYFARTLGKHLLEVDKNQLKEGDLLLMKFDNNPQHVAIVAQSGTDVNIIHCYASARQVVEHILDKQWKERIIKAYRFPAWQQ